VKGSAVVVTAMSLFLETLWIILEFKVNMIEKKPHPMDDCFNCDDPRFKHEGKLGFEGLCLDKNCPCSEIGFQKK